MIEKIVKGMKHLLNRGKRSRRICRIKKRIFSRCEILSQDLCCLKTSSNNRC